jgi:hypothetical protein
MKLNKENIMKRHLRRTQIDALPTSCIKKQNDDHNKVSTRQSYINATQEKLQKGEKADISRKKVADNVKL